MAASKLPSWLGGLTAGAAAVPALELPPAAGIAGSLEFTVLGACGLLIRPLGKFFSLTVLCRTVIAGPLLKYKDD